MYKYILFDLDGTISDSQEGICKSVQHALSKYGIEVNDIKTLTPFIGPPLRDSFKSFYNIPDEKLEECIAFYRERYSTIGLFENVMYDGIPELLKDLKENGKKLAIASSKPQLFVEKILDYFGILKYFDVITGSTFDGSLEKKTDIITMCFQKLFGNDDCNKAECVMIGDRKFDMEAANELSIPNIGVTYGFGDREELENSKALYIVDTVKELYDILM